MPTGIWRRKIQTPWSSGTHFLTKNKNFDNGNSLRMTEQEDILPCYITKRGNLEPSIFWSRFTIITGRCFRLEAAFRNPSQNSQGCFRWNSKCAIKRGLRKFGAKHIKNNAAKNNCWIKVFVTVKTCSSFLNYVSSTSLYIALKVISSKRRRVVLLMESVQISRCGFVWEHEDFDVSN